MNTLIKTLKRQKISEEELYSAFAVSELSVDNVIIKNGIAKVYLVGQLNLGGMCDSPRLQAQLEETILQFSEVSSTEIFINNNPLAEIVSGE